MNPEAFLRSIDDETPPAGLTAALVALWWDRKGDWDRAHHAVAEEEGSEAAWVHAYLHRREGDAGNARYWYGQAGRTPCAADLAGEWDDILRTLLAASTTARAD